MLNPKQAKFIKEYLIDLNAKQAAIRAGYSEKTAESQGSRLLSNAKVRKVVQEAMDKRSAKLEITSDYVLSTIKETIERCRQAEPVLDRKGEQVYVDTPDGNIVPAFCFDSKGVLKGCELLGKHLKLFIEKVEHSGPDGQPIVLKVVYADERDRPKS